MGRLDKTFPWKDQAQLQGTRCQGAPHQALPSHDGERPLSPQLPRDRGTIRLFLTVRSIWAWKMLLSSSPLWNMCWLSTKYDTSLSRVAAWPILFSIWWVMLKESITLKEFLFQVFIPSLWASGGVFNSFLSQVAASLMPLSLDALFVNLS